MASKMKALMTEARWRGFWGTVRAVKYHRLGTMECYVGEDAFQNKFFEDRTRTYGRHRWVEYIDGHNPDSLKITPEWHAWLHHNTEVPPSKSPLPEPSYKVPATGNTTGTDNAYVPPHHRLNSNFRGGATEKFESWKPASKPQQQKQPDVDVLDLK